MQDETAVLPAPKRTARNKGKLIGAKPPLLAKHVGSIRTKLQSRYHQRRWIQSFAKCKPARLWVLLLLLRSGDRGDDWGVTRGIYTNFRSIRPWWVNRLYRLGRRVRSSTSAPNGAFCSASAMAADCGRARSCGSRSSISTVHRR
jgi:hypothetical protein